MRKNESLVLDGMRVVVGRKHLVRSNESCTRRVSFAVRSNRVRLHIEEARARAFRADVRRGLSPARRVVTRVRGSRASLGSCKPRVDRGCARLHTSWTHVRRDISVVD
jgi:hypothetical protein